jgi:hypothetical protein
VFIEEKASNNIVIGNTFTGSRGQGLLTYSSLGDYCENNLIVANKISCPGGLSFRHARNTFIFNNNIQTGAFNVQWSVDNYMSQNLAVNGAVNLESVADNPYFAAPYFNGRK